MVVKQLIDPLREKLPIFIVGAGGIVRDGHLPAYRKAGFSVMGICDQIQEKAVRMKEDFPEIHKAYESIHQFVNEYPGPVVFDVAVPASEALTVLSELPDGAVVLLQKPMGETLAEARAILKMCEQKSIIPAVNFQLRHAPFALAVRDMIASGALGEVFDVEIVVCVYTPWHLWDFLNKKPRVEILYHSIHYLDLIRSLLGEPDRIYASTVRHPSTPHLASTRSSMILQYGGFIQARVIANHGHGYGPQEQQSYLKIEGTKGAIKVQIGVSLDYPKGRPDSFAFVSELTNGGWRELKLLGSWFPDAFAGPMTALQLHALSNNEDKLLLLRDNFETMRLVEAAYRSSEQGGTIVKDIS